MDLILTNLKALIVVLAVAVAVFVVAKPSCLRFMAAEDFTRRRNIWIALTATAFLSPSFWLYFLVAVPLVAWGARKDPNPAALYLLLMIVTPPQVGADIPVVGINALFKMDGFRILAFALLAPVAWRRVQSKDKSALLKFDAVDGMVLAYIVLQLVMLMPHESITNTMRRAFLFVVDLLLLYFVMSRAATSRREVAEVMACFCLACVICAPVAVYETFQSWLLYSGVSEQWDAFIRVAHVRREGRVRAMASAGHSFRLGYVLAVAFGFWLYLGWRTRSTLVQIGIVAVLWAGMIAAYSRGPWLAAAVMFFTYLGLGPNGPVRLLKGLLLAALLAGAVLASPMGEAIIDTLPFIGRVGEENESYRQLILQIAWSMIQNDPLFGNPNVFLYLESLRQGEGVIDIVNVYALIAMYYGLVGLSLFLAPFLVSMWRAYRLVRQVAVSDPELSLLGASLIAGMAGTLFILAVGSLNALLDRLLYVLMGLAVAYVRLGQAKEPGQSRPEAAPAAAAHAQVRRGGHSPAGRSSA